MLLPGVFVETVIVGEEDSAFGGLVESVVVFELFSVSGGVTVVVVEVVSVFGELVLSVVVAELLPVSGGVTVVVCVPDWANMEDEKKTKKEKTK